MTRLIRKKSKAEPAPPTTLFLFGAHGDLVKRLLMPALYNLESRRFARGWTADHRR